MSDEAANRTRAGLAEDARERVAQALAPDARAEDEAALVEWAERGPQNRQALADAFDMHGRLLDVRDGLRADPEIAAMLAAARQGPPASRPSVGMGRRAFLTGAVAASAAGGLALVNPPFGLWPSLGELGADYRTGTGERRTVQIAGGLAVELNTRTALARRDDDKAFRLQLIAGEVAVDARRLARPAVIETHLGQASTSDGNFSARLQDDGMCVTCLAGEVAVSGERTPAMRLVRGQRVVVGGEAGATVIPVNPDVADAWRRGELIFNERPLSEVVAEINRYRSGRIVITNSRIASRSVNAVFRLDRLDSAPSRISTVFHASVTYLPSGIVLLS